MLTGSAREARGTRWLGTAARTLLPSMWVPGRDCGLEGFVLIDYLEEKWIEFTKGPLKVRDDISFCSNTFSESLVALSNYIEANSLKIH